MSRRCATWQASIRNETSLAVFCAAKFAQVASFYYSQLKQTREVVVNEQLLAFCRCISPA